MNTVCARSKAGIALLAAMALLFSCLSFVLVSAPLMTKAADLGDVNKDGAVNMYDVVELFQYVSGAAVPDEEATVTGDVDENSALNMYDLQRLFEAVSGGNPLPTTTTTTTTTTTAPVVVEDIDMLIYDNIVNTENATVTPLSEGGWLIEATAAGSVGITGPGSYDASVLKYTHISLKADVPFDVSFYDGVNNKWMTAHGDFTPNFGQTASPELTQIPAGNYEHLSMYSNGCYTWDGSALPEDVAINSIYIEPKAEGNIVITHLLLSQDQFCTCDIPSVTLPTTATTTTTRYMQGETVTFTAASATASVGDTIEIPISVTENHYMVNGQIYVEYDPTVLEIQKVWDDEDNPYFEGVNTKIIKSSYMWAFAVPEAGMAKFAFASSSSLGTTAGGDIYTLTFKVIDEAPEGSAVKIIIPEMCSNDGTTNGGVDYNTMVATVDGVVTTV